MQLVPVSGQLNCTQWRKLNAYDNSTNPPQYHKTTPTKNATSNTIQPIHNPMPENIDTAAHPKPKIKKLYFLDQEFQYSTEQLGGAPPT